MKKIILTIVKYVLAFGIAILLLWWSFHGLTDKDYADLKMALTSANYLMLVPVFGLLLLSHWFRALRWRELILPLGYNPKSYHLLLGILLGYITNQLVPRAGEIVRCTSVSKPTKTPSEKLVGTIVAERAFDVVCLLVITIFTIIIEYSYIDTYASEIYHGILRAASGNGKWFFIGGLIVFILLVKWLRKKFRSHKWFVFIGNLTKGLMLGLTGIGKVKHK